MSHLFGVAAFLFSNFQASHPIFTQLDQKVIVGGALEIEIRLVQWSGAFFLTGYRAKQGSRESTRPNNSMGERDGLDPPDDEVARRLNFATPGSETRERHRYTNEKKSSSPSEAASVRDPLHGYRNGIHSKRRWRKRRTFGIGVLTALMVWMLCIACLAVMVWLNCDGCSELGMEGV